MSFTKVSKGRIGGAGLDQPGLSRRALVIPLGPTTTAAVRASGKKLPAGSIVESVSVNISTVTAGTSAFSLSAGPGAATTGYIAGLSIASAGVRRLSTASGTVTRGALLRETTSGAAASVECEHVINADTEINWNTSVAVPTLQGVIVIEFRKL
jgi:hypothetical protein